VAHYLGYLQFDVHYCYQCFDRVAGEEWERYCASRLAEMIIKRCGTVIYCHTLVRPGYCPFRIGDSNPDFPASRRLESWTRDHKLWTHISKHLDQCQWSREYPHPLYDTSFKDGVDFNFISYTNVDAVVRVQGKRPAQPTYPRRTRERYAIKKPSVLV
jgi:hypothetical protein